MRLGSRVPGILFLALVLIAGGLLVAGWGVAVGAGVLIGVALGLVAAVVSLSGMPRGAGWTYSAGDRASPGVEPGRDLIERHGRDFSRVATVVSGRLRRVIAVGRSVDVGGVRVELLALELREEGGIGLVAAHVRPPAGQAGHFAIARVDDDRATEYVAAGQASGTSTPGTTRLEVLFAPAPPADAGVLTLTIERFVDPFAGGTVIDGPWSFEVDLHG